MSKVLVDRDLLERLMRADADMGREGSASFTLDASDRLDRAWAELRAILAKPEDPEGFEIARHSKRLVEQLRSDLSAVTAERDRLLQEKGAPDGFVSAPLEPSLAMQNAGWHEIASQGIDPEAVEIGPIYRAMIAATAAKET
ncbi:MAG: hypothetical protein H5U32_02510 [Pseudomonas balearica]|uniref:hypothetical protein n=1 Tax=Stutzerimonas balearica TaxID=74829 RepID=UPI0019C2F40B|nr:hypothetical protein [Stutzerimonas balearica]MBC7198100.1 hypothetical protein [Stutzerimonas balearica]